MAGRKLRSQAWFGQIDFHGFIHRGWLKNQGWPDDMFDGRPVIGICNSWSELTPCNAHFRELADWVRRGILEAGGFPLEFPVTSLGEPLMRPTTMMFRNLVSMDVEESIRANPLDGVVLLMGCDKTTPALMMGAASCDLPTIGVSGGPMLTGRFRGAPLGSGTGLFRMADDVRAGRMSREEFQAAEGCMNRSKGHCMTMGTASTMACMVEALGIALPGNASFPAVDAGRHRLAQLSGRRIVELVREHRTMSQFLDRRAFENAIGVLSAIGGSTNAVIHLTAIARRLGVELCLEDFDRLASSRPCLVNMQPSGAHLMEDFHYAGGLQAVMREMLEAGWLHGDAATVNGLTVGENCAEAPNWNRDVIHAAASPFKTAAGIAVLKGNLAPSGAIIKTAAASPLLMRHRGRAVVFEDVEDLHARIDDEQLDVDADSVLVLKNCGPKGYPGMAEVGVLPIPAKLLRAGVTDMVRISDARMSGTAFGTIVLHVSPEAADGGPLAALRDGDIVSLDVEARRIEVELTDAEIARRLVDRPETPLPGRGYAKLYCAHVMQAHDGADFDFLVGGSGADVPRDSH